MRPLARLEFITLEIGLHGPALATLAPINRTSLVYGRSMARMRKSCDLTQPGTRYCIGWEKIGASEIETREMRLIESGGCCLWRWEKTALLPNSQTSREPKPNVIG